MSEISHEVLVTRVRRKNSQTLIATKFQRMEGSSHNKIQCSTCICLSMTLRLSKSSKRNCCRRSTRTVCSRELLRPKARWEPKSRAMCKTERTAVWGRKYISLISDQSVRLNTYWPIHTVWFRSNHERWRSITRVLALTSTLIYISSISSFIFTQRQSQTSSRTDRLSSLQRCLNQESTMKAWAWSHSFERRHSILMQLSSIWARIPSVRCTC